MRHFIAYHNTEKMGHNLQEDNPLRLLTNKHVNHLLRNMVWIITGEGSGPRQYALGSVLRVTEIGEAEEKGFERFATGHGHVFEPPIPINEKAWFPTVLRVTGHFALGVLEIKDEEVITELIQLAMRDGYEIGTFQYPEPKTRELTDEEKRQLRDRIERGETDIYALAREFGCTSSQVAGIKAAINR